MQPTRFRRLHPTQNHRDWVYKSFHLGLSELPSDKGLIGHNTRSGKSTGSLTHFANLMPPLRTGLGLKSLVVDLALRRWQCAYGHYRLTSSRHFFHHWQHETNPTRRFFQPAGNLGKGVLGVY